MDHRENPISPGENFRLQDVSNLPGGDASSSQPAVDEQKLPGVQSLLTPGPSRNNSTESSLSDTNFLQEHHINPNGGENRDFSSLMYYPTDDPASGRPYSSLQFVYNPEVSDISDCEDSDEKTVENRDSNIKYPNYDLSDSGIKRALTQLYGSLPIVDRKHTQEIRPQSSKDSQDLTKDDNIITSEKKPKNSTEVPAQIRTSSSVPTFCDVVVNDQSTHATSSQANAENRDPNIDRQHESRDVRLSDLDMSHLNGEGSSQLERPKQEKINDNTNNQRDSSQAGKMKTNQAYSARAHPYKFPFKCNRIPTKNRDHVLEYPEWDFPSLDQHSGGLDVLDLKKVAYLGGPNKQDVMLCENGKDPKKKYVLKFFPQKSERFLRELKAVKDIQHPYIVSPISYRSVRSVCYTVTNYFPTGSLANYIGELPIQTIVRYFIKIANGLSFLHACHVTHRDLRPENIMIDDCDNPMISDFDMSDTLRPGAGISEARRRTEADINFIRRYGTKVNNVTYYFITFYFSDPADI